MPSLYPPPYPVINRHPTVGAAFANFNLSDIGKITGATVFSAAFGFMTGAPIRRPQMWFCGSLGLFAGLLTAHQCSSARLMGYQANPGECARYGLTFPAKEDIPARNWVVTNDSWYRKE